jgi:hypothetical protein
VRDDRGSDLGTGPAVDDVPAAMREEVLRLRHTDAGRFALKLYAQHRVRSPDADRPAIPA